MITNNSYKLNKNIFIRPVIITIMGHVNHGKSSLLESILNIKIIKNEIGNITQNIKAYIFKNKKINITFIDTPGHKDFISMRNTGMLFSDIIILIIAIDDGIMSQTKEILSYILKNKLKLIIVISKIDKKKNNLNNIYIFLKKKNIISEEYGGEYSFIFISNKTKEGIKSLLENIFIKSEYLKLKTLINIPAKGIILESWVDKGKGPMAKILIKKGILKIGDIILSENTYGKIKSINDINNNKINIAYPAIPVEIQGFINIPISGKKFKIVINKIYAKKKIIENNNKNIKYKKKKEINLLLNKKKKIFNLILKTNIYGELKVLKLFLKKIFKKKKINLNIINSNVGNIIENDLNLANITKSVIIIFNLNVNNIIKNKAKKMNIHIYQYKVIYEIKKDIKKIIKNIIKKNKKKKIGLLKVKKIFNLINNQYIFGCYVIKGIIKKKSKIHLFRNNNFLWKGKLKSLQYFKKDINKVKKGLECGLSLKNFNDVKIGDLLKIF